MDDIERVKSALRTALLKAQSDGKKLLMCKGGVQDEAGKIIALCLLVAVCDHAGAPMHLDFGYTDIAAKLLYISREDAARLRDGWDEVLRRSQGTEWWDLGCELRTEFKPIRAEDLERTNR